jgi:competence protein ComEC
VSADWKSARVAAPVLDRVRVTTVTGFIEQMDYRRQGARFVMRLASAEGLSPEQMPRRIRLTDRYRPPAEAVAFVKLKARLLPPAHAAIARRLRFRPRRVFRRARRRRQRARQDRGDEPAGVAGDRAHLLRRDRSHAQCAGAARLHAAWR